ncbi:hypothetical protein BJ508DRAFT_333015 [Ascobolus immersus RN42]|uniref:F-box domain-containing protein n=1 Tax=Ascobolus immersus RN42 TaxID=1160509 RepID=A0A3N4HXX5_ASCIM|nr:hypothetical protein BJ508DRAFT_333015 [Ascobolus immersus RN42]
MASKSVEVSHDEVPINEAEGIILNLPVELWIEVYLLLPDLDAVSLSSTCKLARAVYDCDLRIGFQSIWPLASRLLDLRRPGSWPAWKEQAIVRRMTSSRRKDDGSGEAQHYNFFGVWEEETPGEATTSWRLDGLPNIASTGYSKQGLLAKRTLESHQLFITRISLFYCGREFRRNKFMKQLSETEKERIIKALYTAVYLELSISCFTCCRGKNTQVREEEDGSTAQLLDYAPLFRLGYRELLELAVVVRKFSVIPDEAKDKHATPVLDTAHLRTALSTVLTIKTKLHYDVFERPRGFHLLCSPEPYDPSFDTFERLHSEGGRQAFGGIFLDCSHMLFSSMFALLALADQKLVPKGIYAMTVAAVLLPPIPEDSDESFFRKYTKTLVTIGRVWSHNMKLEFQHVRVSKDGLFLFDEEGNIVDDDAPDGRWSIFKIEDLDRIRRDRARGQAK